MQGTKLLLLTLVVYVSGRGLPNYERTNVWPRPLYRPSYTPKAGPVNSVYSAPPENQPPLSDRTSLKPAPAYKPAISQPSPDQKQTQLTIPPIRESESVPVAEYKIPSQPIYSPISPQPAIPEQLDLRPRHIKRRSLNTCNLKPTPCTEAPTTCTAEPTSCTVAPTPCTAAPTSCTVAPTPCTEAPTPCTEAPTPCTEARTPSSEALTPSTEAPTPSTEAPTPSTEALTPSTEAPTPSTEALTPSTEAPTPSTEAPTPSTEAPTPSTEALTPSTEAPTPSTEASTPSTEALTPSNTIQHFECSRGNGYYPVVNESHTYIECQSEKASKHSCPDGLYFNSQALYPKSPCANSSEVKCDNSTSKCNGQVVPDMTPRSEICTKQNAFFVQVGSCDSYIECREFHATNKTCPDGLHYNPSALWPDNPCGYPTDVPCLNRGSVQPARPTADCPHQYGIFPALNSTPGNCGSYRMCVEGRATEVDCPIGLAFNDVNKRCDWPYQVPSCNAEEFLGFKCPTAPVNADGEPLDMNYKYEKDSHYYFSCSRGLPLLMSCAFGLVFDPVQSKCVDLV